MWSDTERERAKQYGTITDNLHTDLHECLGHGSGKLLPGVDGDCLLYTSLDGMDALLAIVQMPPGIPVATVGINGSLNAAILAPVSYTHLDVYKRQSSVRSP